MAKVEAPPAELPPNVPMELSQLRRAMVLLGERAKGKGELRASVRAELIGLVGQYPDPTTATIWKRALKSIQDDEIFERTG